MTSPTPAQPPFNPPQPGPHSSTYSSRTVSPEVVEQLSRQVRRGTLFTALALVVALFSLAVSAVLLVRGGTPTAVATPVAPAATASAVASTTAPVAKPQPANAGTAPTGTIVLGVAGKGFPVLDIYEDFQCPVCEQLEARFGKQFDELVASNKVEVRYHVMSFLDQNLRNDSSKRSANGGFCAHEQGKFLAYHDAVYANSPATEGDGWTDAQLATIATKAGLDVPAWQSCVASGKNAALVTAANDLSLKSGITGTPTIKINGVKVDVSAVDAAGGFVAAIDAVR